MPSTAQLLISQLLILYTEILPLSHPCTNSFYLLGITFNHTSFYKLFLMALLSINQYNSNQNNPDRLNPLCWIKFSPTLFYYIVFLWSWPCFETFTYINHVVRSSAEPALWTLACHPLCVLCTRWRVLIKVPCLGHLKTMQL